MWPHLLGRRKINLSTVFAGQNVGVKEVSDKIWLVSFMHYDLGFFDHESRSLRKRGKPIRPESVTHVSGINVTYVTGIDPSSNVVERDRNRTTDTRIFSPQFKREAAALVKERGVSARLCGDNESACRTGQVAERHSSRGGLL